MSRGIDDFFNNTVVWNTVDMNVEDIHEDRDLVDVLMEKSIVENLFNDDNLAIRGADERVALSWNESLRISKKIQDEKCDDQRDHG